MALYKTICVLRQQNEPLYGVVAADDSIATLALFVPEKTRRWNGFVTSDDLPAPYRTYAGKLRKEVLADVRMLLLFQAIAGISDDRLWYHEGDGYWQAAQSLIDQYKPLQRQVWQLPAAKGSQLFNDHRWHGRPRRDRDNGTVEGTSTGRGRYSQLR